ncbi:unnamed protein product [Mytilus coruscus]|uniref:Uncharacterized protein n=1 Tax=Mytilus coruscus TaxID=42192 RepID=A0A6J8DNM8_MYTCO|nr:unnamed protein product [Mytilus coruscus]
MIQGPRKEGCDKNSDNETLASDLRYLCAAELYVNSSFYTNLDVFRNNGEFGMSLTGSAENVLTSTNNREAAIRHEALETCCKIPRPKWSRLIHIAALASVLKRPVYSVYPSNTEFPYRHLFHQQFNPRDCQVLASDHGSIILTIILPWSGQPIYILWSVDGGLPNGPFTPNHFVSVCLRTNNPVNNTLAEKNKKRKGNLTDYFMPKRTKPATLQSDENASEKGDPQSDENAAEKREPVNYLTDDHMVSSTTAPGAELIVIIIINSHHSA